MRMQVHDIPYDLSTCELMIDYGDHNNEKMILRAWMILWYRLRSVLMRKRTDCSSFLNGMLDLILHLY